MNTTNYFIAQLLLLANIFTIIYSSKLDNMTNKNDQVEDSLLRNIVQISLKDSETTHIKNSGISDDEFNDSLNQYLQMEKKRRNKMKEMVRENIETQVEDLANLEKNLVTVEKVSTAKKMILQDLISNQMKKNDQNISDESSLIDMNLLKKETNGSGLPKNQLSFIERIAPKEIESHVKANSKSQKTKNKYSELPPILINKFEENTEEKLFKVSIPKFFKSRGKLRNPFEKKLKNIDKNKVNVKIKKANAIIPIILSNPDSPLQKIRKMHLKISDLVKKNKQELEKKKKGKINSSLNFNKKIDNQINKLKKKIKKQLRQFTQKNHYKTNYKVMEHIKRHFSLVLKHSKVCLTKNSIISQINLILEHIESKCINKNKNKKKNKRCNSMIRDKINNVVKKGLEIVFENIWNKSTVHSYIPEIKYMKIIPNKNKISKSTVKKKSKKNRFF